MIQIPELWVKAKGTGPSSKACSFPQLPQARVGEKAQPTAATGCWFGISTEPQIKLSPLNSKTNSRQNFQGYPPWAPEGGSGVIPPFLCPFRGAALQEGQARTPVLGTARIKGQGSKVKRSQEGRRQDRAHPHPTLPASSQALVCRHVAQIDSSPLRAENYPFGCFSPPVFIPILLISTTAGLFFTTLQHPVDFSMAWRRPALWGTAKSPGTPPSWKSAVLRSQVPKTSKGRRPPCQASSGTVFPSSWHLGYGNWRWGQPHPRVLLGQEA